MPRVLYSRLLTNDDDLGVRQFLLDHGNQKGVGLIYAIRTKQPNSPIKIGWSVNPTKRIKTLQTGNYYELEMIAVVPGSQMAEQMLHTRLRAERVRGEWFTGDKTREFVRDMHVFARYAAETFTTTGKMPVVPTMLSVSPTKLKADIAKAQEPRPSAAAIASVGKLHRPNVYNDGGKGRKSMQQELDELRVDGKLPLYIRRKAA